MSNGNVKIEKVVPMNCCGNCKHLGENVDVFTEIECDKGVNLREGDNGIVHALDLYTVKCPLWEY